ncbi:hypothetical protein H1S01_17250 [Heliobacterium chlorum]|uniref:SMODS and SLOG-associating 2TM effector domain-containing protein n=1 Tax=Heliobacterium chlorum TaxID=2698 RepID=A0ABR7T610_HELCL|nr:hypothetical protein [Heliobacterium chlorum]MBC9786212.1 hypothetical protein [Heliobacterium chlorum]
MKNDEEIKTNVVSVYTLLRFYKSNLSERKIIVEKAHIRYGIIYSFGTTSILSIFLAIKPFNVKYFITSIILIFLSLSILEYNHKKILKSNYNIDVPLFYSNQGINTVRLKKVVQFLSSHGIKEKDQLDSLVKALDKEAENKKYSPFIIPGVILSLLIPVWNNYLSWGYKNITDYSEGFIYALQASGFIILVAFLISLIKRFFYLNSLSYTINSLSVLVQQVLVNKNLMEDIKQNLNNSLSSPQFQHSIPEGFEHRTGMDRAW